MKPKNKYNDVKFFLFFIAFVSAFNYYLTYNNIKPNWFLAITYTLDTVQGWLAWWAMRSIIIFLDRKMPYDENPLKRIILQTIATTFAGLFVISLLTEIVAWIVRGHSAPLNFYTFDVFIIVIWLLVFNGIYIGLHYFHEWSQSEMRRLEEQKMKSNGFHVKLGRQDILVPFDEIIGFYSESGFTYLQTIRKNYLYERSLDKTEELVPSGYFFRLNRQYIIHRDAVIGFKRLNDSKLEVAVKASGNIPANIPVSRIRAAEFKRWFQPEKN